MGRRGTAYSFLIELIGSLFDEILKVAKPLHVQSLVFVKRHALDEGSEVLVHTKSFQVLGHGGLDSLVKGGVVGTTVLLHLSVEAVGLAVGAEVLRDLAVVVVDLGVHGSSLDDKSLLGSLLTDVDSEVAVVLRETLFFLRDVLSFRLLVLRKGLSINQYISGTLINNRGKLTWIQKRPQ